MNENSISRLINLRHRHANNLWYAVFQNDRKKEDERKLMAETGHSKNVENWQKMIAACNGMGADYQPTNANLAHASMNTLLTFTKPPSRSRLCFSG